MGNNGVDFVVKKDVLKKVKGEDSVPDISVWKDLVLEARQMHFLGNDYDIFVWHFDYNILMKDY